MKLSIAYMASLLLALGSMAAAGRWTPLQGLMTNNASLSDEDDGQMPFGAQTDQVGLPFGQWEGQRMAQAGAASVRLFKRAPIPVMPEGQSSHPSFVVIHLPHNSGRELSEVHGSKDNKHDDHHRDARPESHHEHKR